MNGKLDSKSDLKECEIKLKNGIMKRDGKWRWNDGNCYKTECMTIKTIGYILVRKQFE